MQAQTSSSALLRKRKPSKRSLASYGPARPTAECNGLSLSETLQGRRMQFQPKGSKSDVSEGARSSVTSQNTDTERPPSESNNNHVTTTPEVAEEIISEKDKSKSPEPITSTQPNDTDERTSPVVSVGDQRSSRDVPPPIGHFRRTDDITENKLTVNLSGDTQQTSGDAQEPVPEKRCPSDQEKSSSSSDTSSFDNFMEDSDDETPENSSEALTAQVKKCRQACQAIPHVKPSTVEGEKTKVKLEFAQNVYTLYESYFHFDITDVCHTELTNFRNSVGDIICETEALNILLDFVADSIKKWDFFEDNGNGSSYYWATLQLAMGLVGNYSDAHSGVKRSIVKHKDLMLILVKSLGDQIQSHLDGSLSSEQEELLDTTFTVVHNAGSLEENVLTMRNLDLISIVLKYLDSSNSETRLNSIAILADLVNESEAKELLGTHTHIFSFVLKRLSDAVDKDDRRSQGWSVEELARAVKQLARNDANKKKLVEENCLPILTKIVQTGTTEELNEALTCLWYLSFEQDNKEQILAEPGLVAGIRDKSGTLTGHGKRACQGILWALGDQLLTQRVRSDLDTKSQPKNGRFAVTPIEEIVFGNDETAGTTDQSMAPGGESKFKGHVMISYQSGNKEIIKTICSDLRKQGIPVWLDIDNMEGSTLQAMAQAVEDSFAVIIAMCQRYKDSPNTRAEAEYAFQQRKPIIPLKLQPNYNPDGWLGIILGTKLFYDFSGKYTYESRMDKLVKAVFKEAGGQSESLDTVDGGQMMTATTVSTVEAAPVSVLTHRPKSATRLTSVARQIALRHQVSEADEWRVQAWSKQDVSSWLTKYKLEDSRLTDMSGDEILFMHRLRFEAPEFFYKYLKKDLQISSLLDLAKATKAFENLSIDQ